MENNSLTGRLSESLGDYLAARTYALRGNAFVCPYPSALETYFADNNEACLPDSDADGVPDAEDTFPSDPLETADTDSDGVGDNADAFPNDAS